MVETQRAGASGEEKVARALFDRQDSAFSTCAEGENGFFCRADTPLAWTEEEIDDFKTDEVLLRVD